MKTAIMQPYIFPYIGYFQLINVVDKFIFYDDVDYIKQGWINRNRILICNTSAYFTLPLDKPSSFKKINETFINHNLYPKWKNKFIKTLEQNYSKAPMFEEVLPLIKLIMDRVNLTESISGLAYSSVIEICNYLNIDCKFIKSSSKYENKYLNGQERVIDICIKENSSVYINFAGGQHLYDKNLFLKNDITLNFIKANLIKYNQYNAKFIPGLSIIDVLMFNNRKKIENSLNNYELI